jgi:hypothetical protein
LVAAGATVDAAGGATDWSCTAVAAGAVQVAGLQQAGALHVAVLHAVAQHGRQQRWIKQHARRQRSRRNRHKPESSAVQQVAATAMSVKRSINLRIVQLPPFHK